MAAHEITFPASAKDVQSLRAGDPVYVSGTIYTARDAAHKRLCEMLAAGEPLPVPLAGQAIYYCGPCPAPPGRPIGSCGPTSALRMDAYAPVLFDEGVTAVIAKGPFCDMVTESIARNGAVYLCAAGGAGALIAHSVREAEPAAFEDLGTESIKRLVVDRMPVIVGIDSTGQSLFAEGKDGGV